MPVMKNRPTKGPGKSAQVRRPAGGQPTNGVQQFDGRKNTNGGTQVSAAPKDLDGKDRVIRTY